MATTIKDGTGKGFEWQINKDNKGEVNAVTLTEEHHENEDNQRSWTIAFDAVDPTSSDDYFLHIKNTDTAVRTITRITVSSTVAGILEVQKVTGTSIGGAAEQVNSMTLGSPVPSNFTAESAVDITGLTDDGVLRFITLEANVERVVEFPQGIRMPQNEQVALLWTITTGILTGNVDIYEEG